MPSADQNVNTGTRLASMLLDHCFMTVIAAVFFVPAWINFFVQLAATSPDNTRPLNIFTGVPLYLALFGFSLYMCKDCINGRSLAKRILRHQVVNNTTGQLASPLQCLVRNLFCCIWPVEFIVVLINPARRLGDRVAGTRVASYNANTGQLPVKPAKVLVAVLISYTLALLMTMPLRDMQQAAGKFDRNAYNETASKKLSQLYIDSLGAVMIPRVKVYDKNDIPGVRYYIVVSCSLKGDYTEGDTKLDKVEGAAMNYLYAVFPKDSIVGEIIFSFSDGHIMDSQSFQLGKGM